MATQLSRRAAMGTMLAMGGAAALAACSGSPAPTTGGQTVALWDWFDTQSAWVKNEMKMFEAANPKIKVQRTMNATITYDKLLGLAQRGGTSPDVFMIGTGRSVPLNIQVQNKLLLPLDQFADSSWIRQFPPYSFVEGSNVFGGKIYSAPLTAPAPWAQLYINNQVFKDAGLTNSDGSVKVPKTWDDMTRAAATIGRKSNGAVYGFGFGNSSGAILPWWVEVLVRGAGTPGGSDGLDFRTGKYTFGSDRNYADLIQLILEWKSKGYFFPTSLSSSDEISRAFFERGKFGMTVGGVWNQPGWTAHKFTDYTVTTLIGPEETPKGYWYSSPGGVNLGINAKAKNPEAAWKWFSWWYSTDAGKRWVQDYTEDLSVFPQNNNPSKIKFPPFAQFVALRNRMLPGPQPWIKNPALSFVVLNPGQPDFGAITTGLYSGQITDVAGTLTSLAGRKQAALDTGLKRARDAGHNVNTSDYAFPDWDITKAYKWDIPEYPA